MKKILLGIAFSALLIGGALQVTQTDVQKNADIAAEDMVFTPQAYDPGDGVRP